MTLRQKLGSLLVALGVFVSGGTYALTPNQALSPVPLADLGLSPDHAEQSAVVAATTPQFFVAGADAQDNKTKNVRLWDAVLKVHGSHTPNYPQQIGDCVSLGVKNVGEYLQCNQIALDNEGEFHLLFPPYNYGYSRVDIGKGRIRGDGSVGAWGAQSAVDGGVLPTDAEQCPPYDGRTATEWGRNGPPQWAKDVARKSKVKTIAQMKSAQEVCDAICNRFPVTIASNFGTSSIQVKDGRRVARWNSSWAHQMAVVAFDGTSPSGERYFYVLNSWGPKAHPDPLQGEPPGGFWVTWSDMDRIVKQGDSWAFSAFDGFPALELDFDVFGATAIASQPQGEPIMLADFEPVYGHGVGVVLTLLGLMLWIVRGNVLRRVAMMPLITLAMIVPIHAAELNFDIIGGKSTTTSSTTSSECDLNFDVIGDKESATACSLDFDVFSAKSPCNCGPDCKCLDCDCKAKTATAEPPARRVQWLMFSAPGCVPCTIAKSDFRPWLERSGWEVSPTPQAQVRLIDAEADAELASEFNVRQFPTFVLVRDGKEVDRHEGYPGKAHLAQKYIATVEKQSALQPEKRRYVPPVK